MVAVSAVAVVRAAVAVPALQEDAKRERRVAWIVAAAACRRATSSSNGVCEVWTQKGCSPVSEGMKGRARAAR